MKLWHLASWLLAWASLALAIGQKPIIAFHPSPSTLSLASQNHSVHIVIDDLEWPAVKRAAGDLTLDFGRVTGLNGTVHYMQKSNGSSFWTANSTSWNNPPFLATDYIIIAGTLGRSHIIDQMIKSGKLQAESIVGQWESFTSTVVEFPLSGVSRALVIAGRPHTCLLLPETPNRANSPE